MSSRSGRSGGLDLRSRGSRDLGRGGGRGCAARWACTGIGGCGRRGRGRARRYRTRSDSHRPRDRGRAQGGRWSVRGTGNHRARGRPAGDRGRRRRRYDIRALARQRNDPARTGSRGSGLGSQRGRRGTRGLRGRRCGLAGGRCGWSRRDGGCNAGRTRRRSSGGHSGPGCGRNRAWGRRHHSRARRRHASSGLSLTTLQDRLHGVPRLGCFGEIDPGCSRGVAGRTARASRAIAAGYVAAHLLRLILFDRA